MRGVLVFLLAVLTIGGDRIAANGDARDSPPAITLQIHDYVHLPPSTLTAASDLVTRIYTSIDVQTAWLAPMRQEPFGRGASASRRGGSASPGPSAPRNPPSLPIAQITVIVLTPTMAIRGHIPEGILGFAAVATDGGIGRIAYVIYDRVQQQSSTGAIDDADLFGLVIAHEVGHLLLGPGSHGEAGLMKGQWDREDLRQFRMITPRFSAREADAIRATLATVSEAQASR